MNVGDSSARFAYFADESQAIHLIDPLNDSSNLVVPTVSNYEVFKVVLRESVENHALQAVAAMKKRKVVELTPTLALSAAKLNLTHNLPIDDSIMFATAKAYEAKPWTLDSDFNDFPGVN